MMKALCVTIDLLFGILNICFCFSDSNPVAPFNLSVVVASIAVAVYLAFKWRT